MGYSHKKGSDRNAMEHRETESRTCCPAETRKTKERPEKEYRDLMNRLKRIEGQVRGLQKMLEENAYCTDVMVQASAAVSYTHLDVYKRQAQT